MTTLRLTGLIASLMLSAAVVCAAGMVLPNLLPGGSLALKDALSFGAEAVALLGLVIWLRSTLAAARAHR